MHSHEAVHDCGLGLSIAKGLAFDEVASRGGQENLVARDFSVVAEWSNPADLDVGSTTSSVGAAGWSGACEVLTLTASVNRPSPYLL